MADNPEQKIVDDIDALVDEQLTHRRDDYHDPYSERCSLCHAEWHGLPTDGCEGGGDSYRRIPTGEGLGSIYSNARWSIYDDCVATRRAVSESPPAWNRPHVVGLQGDAEPPPGFCCHEIEGQCCDDDAVRSATIDMAYRRYYDPSITGTLAYRFARYLPYGPVFDPTTGDLIDFVDLPDRTSREGSS